MFWLVWAGCRPWSFPNIQCWTWQDHILLWMSKMVKGRKINYCGDISAHTHTFLCKTGLMKNCKTKDGVLKLGLVAELLSVCLCIQAASVSVVACSLANRHRWALLLGIDVIPSAHTKQYPEFIFLFILFFINSFTHPFIHSFIEWGKS